MDGVKAAAIAASILVITGCAPGASSPDEGAGSSSSGEATEGVVTLRFGVSAGVRASPTLVDPLIGTIHGVLYLASEVTITGPMEDAAKIESFVLEDVDLTMDELAAITWTSSPIPTERYSALCVFDLDGNFSQTHGGAPDPGDPVTLPTQVFELLAGEEIEVIVMLDVVYG